MPAFSELNLCPELLFTLDELGHHTPTPIQAQAIPAILQGHDVMAEAQTGTGKTASFAVPMIEKFGRAPQETDMPPGEGAESPAAVNHADAH